MALQTALRESPGALVRNPVLFLPMLVVLLVQLPILLLQSVNPLLGSVASAFFSLVSIVGIPFLQGGLFAMADEALDGRTSLATFVDSGRRHYVAMLIAYLVLLAVNFAIGLVAIVPLVVGGILLLSGGQFGGAGLGMLVAVGGIAAIGLLAYLLVVFFLQFYGQAIVLEDRDAVEGLKRSVRVVRENLLSTFAYVLLIGVVSVVFGIAIGGISTLLSQQAAGVSMMGSQVPTISPLAVVGIGLLVTGIGTLFGGFFAVFSVAFYRRLTA